MTLRRALTRPRGKTRLLLAVRTTGLACRHPEPMLFAEGKRGHRSTKRRRQRALRRSQRGIGHARAKGGVGEVPKDLRFAWGDRVLKLLGGLLPDLLVSRIITLLLRRQTGRDHIDHGIAALLRRKGHTRIGQPLRLHAHPAVDGAAWGSGAARARNASKSRDRSDSECTADHDRLIGHGGCAVTALCAPCPMRGVRPARGDEWCRCALGRDGRRDAFLLPPGPVFDRDQCGAGAPSPRPGIARPCEVLGRTRPTRPPPDRSECAPGVLVR